MEKLTVKQAIEQGYKYAQEENGDILLHLTDLEKEHDANKVYFLCKKDSYPFSIHDDLIFDLVDDYLMNQDDVDNEDGRLNNLAETVDYSQITEALNKAFSTTKYYDQTDIELVF